MYESNPYGLPESPPGLTAARVTGQEKGLYRLVSAQGEAQASFAGRARFAAQTAADWPAVGDYVLALWNGPESSAVIRQVLPRKSCFLRRAAGSAVQEQVVAANVDTVFLCMALDRDFNLRRLERYLSIAWESGAAPVVVLTKADLCLRPQQLAAQAAEAARGAAVLVTSAADPAGRAPLAPYLAPGQTVAFLGSSGVGKSTLINGLLGEARQRTGGLRGDGRGRHTTTGRSLLLLPAGGMVIDTPGMRELGMWSAGGGIDRTFSEVEQLAGQCRFRNCTHTGEPGCAVCRAVEEGALDPARLQAWRKLTAESRYAGDAEACRAEKREKFKAIARANKHNRKR